MTNQTHQENDQDDGIMDRQQRALRATMTLLSCDDSDVQVCHLLDRFTRAVAKKATVEQAAVLSELETAAHWSAQPLFVVRAILNPGWETASHKDAYGQSAAVFATQAHAQAAKEQLETANEDRAIEFEDDGEDGLPPVARFYIESVRAPRLRPREYREARDTGLLNVPQTGSRRPPDYGVDSTTLHIEAWPPFDASKGMSTGQIPTGIRIEHPPTGTTAICQTQRHQHQNKHRAMQAIAFMLRD